jgi:hypothetical protein
MARTTWLFAGLVLLQGCVVNVDTAPIASALPGLASQYANRLPGANVAPASANPALPGVCQNGATPASGTISGAWVLGDYNGVALPGTFGVYQAEQDVTDRITAFSQDTSATGANTWANFQCLFPGAVAVWRRKATTGPVRTAPPAAAAPPQDVAPPVADPPPALVAPPAPPTEVASSPADCPAEIDPANGTINGSAALGAYDGALLPGSFGVYQTEQDVTDRIGRFAADDSAAGRNTWIKFQCFYAQAVAVWRSR